MATAAVPTFYLYGEPHRAVADGFVHIELLDDRSRPSEWTIQPHAHADLHHLFFIATGGGSMRAESQTIAFTAPALLIVPATMVHGFAWASESTGYVLTLSQNHLTGVIRDDPDIAHLFAKARVIGLSAENVGRVQRDMADLMRELSWSAVGHRAAVNAALLGLMVAALRHLDPETSRTAARPRKHAALVARFRERIEQRFRHREPVAAHARALGVSESTLRTACLRASGASPTLMLDQRALLEARRSLLYSNMTVTQIAYAIGFTDPAYFSRFFQDT